RAPAEERHPASPAERGSAPVVRRHATRRRHRRRNETCRPRRRGRRTSLPRRRSRCPDRQHRTRLPGAPSPWWERSKVKPGCGDQRGGVVITGMTVPEEVLQHYAEIEEGRRISEGPGQLELVRVREIVRSHLPPSRSRIADIGGGTGVHAAWLAD